MNFAHQNMSRLMPVVSYPDGPMWLRTLNGSNNSKNACRERQELETRANNHRTTFAKRFAIDIGVLEQA
ncbi:glycosyltransferase [Ruegeria arenilitoris]|uniref:glycosyltransferase n=1 Tax=Ruegeria arenilitoris TaxID=1173585 RepID=UPI0034646393